MRVPLRLALVLSLAALATPLAHAGNVLYDWSMELPPGDPHRHIVRARAAPDAMVHTQVTCYEGAFVQVQVLTTAPEGAMSTGCTPETIVGAQAPAGADGLVILVVTGQGILVGRDPALAHALVWSG